MNERVERQIAELEKEKVRADQAADLMQAEVFLAWMDEQYEDARERAVRSVEHHLSNYEKAMAAGILRYWKAKRSEMERIASREYRQKLVKRLEELNARSREEHEPGSPRGIVDAYGQF